MLARVTFELVAKPIGRRYGCEQVTYGSMLPVNTDFMAIGGQHAYDFIMRVVCITLYVYIFNHRYMS